MAKSSHADFIHPLPPSLGIKIKCTPLIVWPWTLTCIQEEKKSLKERVAAVQEVTQLVQNTIGDIASFGEKIKK